jgi:hypothetical protein
LRLRLRLCELAPLPFWTSLRLLRRRLSSAFCRGGGAVCYELISGIEGIMGGRRHY